MKNVQNIKWGIDLSILPKASADKKISLFILQRMLPEYVWDIVHLEGNPYSFVEVQTLLQGTTIGGHSTFDRTQIINQANALVALRRAVEADNCNINKDLLLSYHDHIAKEEALKWGVFRDGQVAISGTDYMPPTVKELESIFRNGIQAILSMSHPFESALAYFFFGALNQFFYDGNKRTSRLLMNTLLMRNGYYYLSIPGNRRSEFDDVMVNFYNTKDASRGFEFMVSCYKTYA